MELEAGYLEVLIEHYQRDPRLAGVGGVDVLAKPATTSRRLVDYMIGYRAWSPGRLSVTGYGGAMETWHIATKPFESEFLYGCNMSFRKWALEGLPDSDVFVGHGYGEDLYVSHWARRKGRIVVDPHLRVRHYQTPVSRDRMDQVSYRQIYNHFYLLQFMGASAYRKVLFLYTAVGLVLISGARCAADYILSGRSGNVGRVTGGLRGVRDVLCELVGARRAHRTA